MMTTARYYAWERSPNFAGKDIAITGTLTQAKRAATRRFGDGFRNHEIIIVDDWGNIISSRRIADRRWTDRA